MYEYSCCRKTVDPGQPDLSVRACLAMTISSVNIDDCLIRCDISLRFEWETELTDDALWAVRYLYVRSCSTCSHRNVSCDTERCKIVATYQRKEKFREQAGIIPHNLYCTKVGVFSQSGLQQVHRSVVATRSGN